MTHPQPPVGPQYRQLSHPEPSTRPFAATPQPPFSGAAYPVADGGHPGAGGGYQVARVPGYPLIAPPPARTNASKKTAVVVAVTAAVLTLLCCAGGIVALVIGANRVDGTNSNATGTGKP
ncbi:hypothetical protein JOD64_003593 [Micromonospora luteifusca]|uniref:Serine/threonine protein kinase n=1 Tax=Micromonospora luteifusca TaxID=709860 RepID=A0ABS2LW07_9ACTN|nr:hypothetical protein [Micromonospora luteifusca]MBM7492371.1 hypothetical protein [Micromonospora luteifusca]